MRKEQSEPPIWVGFLIFAVVVTLIIVGISSVISCCNEEHRQRLEREISFSDYEDITTWAEEWPELKPFIKTRMDDGKISHREYREIRDQAFEQERLKKIETLKGVVE